MTNLKFSGWCGPWNAYLYLVIQIYFSLVGLWKNRSAIWWELKQLQTSSSRFLLILPRHQSTFPLIYILLINQGDNIWLSEHIHSYKVSCKKCLQAWLAGCWGLVSSLGALSPCDELVCLHRLYGCKPIIFQRLELIIINYLSELGTFIYC